VADFARPSTITGLRVQLAKVVMEAAELRSEISNDFPSSMDEVTVHAIHQGLLTTRGKLDRLEAVAGVLRSLKRQASARLFEVKADQEDAWTYAATTPIRSAATQEPAPRERYAHYDLETLAQKVAVRSAEAELAEITEAYDFVTALVRGADSTRRDLHVLISGRSMTTRLES
jgi:hypothetical protein